MNNMKPETPYEWTIYKNPKIETINIEPKTGKPIIVKEKVKFPLNIEIGDTVQYRNNESDQEVVNSYIWNDVSDFRNDGDYQRVTINGLHWYVEDVNLIKKNTL